MTIMSEPPGSRFFKHHRKLLIVAAALLIGACVFRSRGPYRSAETLPREITDIHCHAAGLGAGNSGCFVSPQLRANWRFRFYLRGFGVTEKEVMGSGDRIIVDRIAEQLASSRYVHRAVLLALDGVVGADRTLDLKQTEMYVPNEFVLAAVNRHPNLLFGASINPYRTDAVERLTRAKAKGAVLVKWIPSIMGIDPADPALTPFYRKLVELNLPLLTHTGQERSFSRSTDVYGDPERLRPALKLGVTVIAAHIASTGRYHGERSTDRLLRLMRSYPNLYSDISSITFLNKLFYIQEALTRPEFSGRLVYGSDFPLINTLLASPWYYFQRLALRQMYSIWKIENPWDSDVLLKQNLGMPADIFARSEELINHKWRNKNSTRDSGVEPGRDVR
jgi:hypothetical protein